MRSATETFTLYMKVRIMYWVFMKLQVHLEINGCNQLYPTNSSSENLIYADFFGVGIKATNLSALADR